MLNASQDALHRKAKGLPPLREQDIATGWSLYRAVGNPVSGSVVKRSVNGKPATVKVTTGVGRNSRNQYIHLIVEVVHTITDPDGKMTVMPHPATRHFRAPIFVQNQMVDDGQWEEL